MRSTVSIHQGKTKAKLRVQIKKENHKRINTQTRSRAAVFDVATTQQNYEMKKWAKVFRIELKQSK